MLGCSLPMEVSELRLIIEAKALVHFVVTIYRQVTSGYLLRLAPIAKLL
jgi:hypothetical protein